MKIALRHINTLLLSLFVALLASGLKREDIDAQLNAAQKKAKGGTKLTTVGEKLAAFTLDDGTMIDIDEDTGVAYYTNEDGTRGDVLPVGEYTLEDGTVLIVGEGGQVQDMLSPETAQQIEKERKEAAEVKQRLTSLQKRATELEAKLKEKTDEGAPPVETKLRGDDNQEPTGVRAVIMASKKKTRSRIPRF